MVFAQFFSPAFVPTPRPPSHQKTELHVTPYGLGQHTPPAPHRHCPAIRASCWFRAHPCLYQCMCVRASLCLYLELVYVYNMEYMFFIDTPGPHVPRGTERRPRLFATCQLCPPSRSHGRFCPEDVRWDGRRDGPVITLGTFYGLPPVGHVSAAAYFSAPMWDGLTKISSGLGPAEPAVRRLRYVLRRSISNGGVGIGCTHQILVLLSAEQAGGGEMEEQPQKYRKPPPRKPPCKHL
jgi:hypothetical protein